MRSKIQDIVTSEIDKLGLYLYDIQIKGSNRKPIISVYVDTDAGITIGQCEELSRALHKIFESDSAIPDDYRLDVSSPGLTSALKHEWQFAKNIGKEMVISSRDEAVGTFEGVLLAVSPEAYEFQVGSKNVVINPETIKKAKLIIKWS